MTLKERIARLFGRGNEEKRTFVVFFKHSQRNIEFESTWEEVKRLSKRFGGEKGLKMNNFFVPWSEVASIYEKDPEEEAPKAGDEMPATPEARALGAETMEVLPSDGGEEPKAEVAKAEEKAEEPKPEEAEPASREAQLGEIKAEAKVELDGIEAEKMG